jgi:hypothetical protein
MNTSWQYPETILVWHSAIDFIYLNNLVKTSKKYLEIILTDVRTFRSQAVRYISIQESLISKASVTKVPFGAKNFLEFLYSG